jgi:hypothetical protein
MWLVLVCMFIFFSINFVSIVLNLINTNSVLLDLVGYGSW